MYTEDAYRGLGFKGMILEKGGTYRIVIPRTPDGSNSVRIIVDGTAKGHWAVRLIECVDSMKVPSLSCGSHDEAQLLGVRWGI